MSLVDSSALTAVRRQLGLSGQGELDVTQLRDDEIIQTFDVTRAARRGLIDVGTTGWFYAAFRNTHLAIGDLSTFIDPYNAGDEAIGTFPQSISDERFDVYIHAMGGRRTAGTGGFTAAFRLAPLTRMQGLGSDNTDTPFTTSTHIMLEAYNDVFGVGGSDELVLDTSTFGAPAVLPSWRAIRIPRGAVLGFVSSAVDAVTLVGTMIISVTPVGLGQDVAE